MPLGQPRGARRRHAPRAGVRLRPRLPEPAVTRRQRPTPAAAPPIAGNRNFRLLWFGEGVSVLGSMTTSVVVPLVAVTAFDAGAGLDGAAHRRRLAALAAHRPAGRRLGRPRRRPPGHDRRRPRGRRGHRVGAGRVGARPAHPPPPRARRAGGRHRVGVPAHRLPPARAPHRRPSRPRAARTPGVVGTESAMQVRRARAWAACSSPSVSAAYAVRGRRGVLPRSRRSACTGWTRARMVARPPAPAHREPLRREVATGIRVVLHDPLPALLHPPGRRRELRAHRLLRAARALPRARPRPRPRRGSAPCCRPAASAGWSAPASPRRASARLGDARAMVVLQVAVRPTAPAHRAGPAGRARGARAARPRPGRCRAWWRANVHPRHLPDALHPAAAARPHHLDVVTGQLRHHAAGRSRRRLARACTSGCARRSRRWPCSTRHPPFAPLFGPYGRMRDLPDSADGDVEQRVDGHGEEQDRHVGDREVEQPHRLQRRAGGAALGGPEQAVRLERGTARRPAPR